ncbi:unnamed protein product [Heterobilharzia americana]|nr:unnamed protein product [Heterobilharzia americana]
MASLNAGKVTAHQSDLANTDSKIPDHSFDESGRSGSQKVCFYEFSSAPTSNNPPVSTNTHFLAKRTSRIHLELEISSGISESKLCLSSSIPSGEDKMGSGNTNTNPMVPNGQGLMNKDVSLISKHGLCDDPPITYTSAKGSGDDLSVRRLDRIKNRLYNSDIINRAYTSVTEEDLTRTASSKAPQFPSDFASEAEYCQNSRTSLLSDRLEARIRKFERHSFNTSW